MTLNDLIIKMNSVLETNEKIVRMLEDDLGMAECAKLDPEQMQSYVNNVTHPLVVVNVKKRRVQTKVRQSLYESDIVRIKQLLGLGWKPARIAKETGYAVRTVYYVKSKSRDYVLTRNAAM